MNTAFMRFLNVGFNAIVVAMTMLYAVDAHSFEVKRDREGNIIRWDADEIDLCLGVELLEAFGVEQAIHAAEGAAAAWSGIPNAPAIRISVSSTRAFDPARVSNCIHWARPWVGAGNELALTYTAADGNGRVHAGDIVLNGHHRFGWAGAQFGAERFDLQAVLTHEMGHLLGLAENAMDDSSTMHPDIGPNETFQRDITDDDRAGVEFVYSSSSKESAAACGMDRQPPRSTGPFGAFVTLLLGVYLIRGRFVYRRGR